MRIFVAGHGGMVGSAVVRLIEKEGSHEVLTCPREMLDLTDAAAVGQALRALRPDVIVMAAARVGGIHANNACPADFIRQNLMIQTAVIDQAHRAGIGRMVFLGSSCIYPRDAAQPMREEALLTGTLEPTNEPYAIAKIAGIKMCESYNRQYGTDYRCLMPTNLYGPGDNFHPDSAHVLPALLGRFDEAARRADDQVVLWGSGQARREFLYVDDLAEAVLHVLELDAAIWSAAGHPQCSHLNVGTGQDISIRDLSERIAALTGFGGSVTLDRSRPDGAPRKLLDVSRINGLGWTARTSLTEGLQKTYDWYRAATEVRRSA